MRVQTGVIALAIAAGLWWLLEQDRMSPLALTVVEWQTRSQLPIPLYVPFLVVGVVGVGMAVVQRLQRPAPPPPRRQPSSASALGQQAAVMPAPGDDRWVVDVLSRARAVPLDPGASLHFDVAAGVPIGLRLVQLTPEAERRSLEHFARYLSTIPTPPRVRVEVGGSTDRAAPQRIRHQLHRALREVFPTDAPGVLLSGDQIDVVFSAPADCWRSRGRVFMDQEG